MREKQVIVTIMSIVLHTIFILLSYNASFLSCLTNLADPVSIERTVMLLQFLPLLIVIINSRLSKSRVLLFLTFAICISTLFTVDDFNSGFYGAVIDNDTNIMPRMRSSAHLIAYDNTGKLEILDIHGEYFLEFVMVHFISRLTSLNSVLAYFFVIRMLAIIIWSLLFVWSSNTITGPRRRIWLLMIAPSIMLANQSYNHEISFGPIMLLILYLIVRKHKFRSSIFPAFLISAAILLVSFRETQLLGLLSLITLIMIVLKKTGLRMYPQPLSTQMFFNLILLVTSFTRTFLLSSLVYAERYANWIVRLVYSTLEMLGGSLIPQEPILTTLGSVQNPLDRAISSVSVFFAVSFLVMIAILSTRVVVKRKTDPFSFAISLTFMIALSIPLGAYAVTKIAGSGPLRDFGSATALARSLAPLAVIMMVPYFKSFWKGHFLQARKLFLILIVVLLSLTVVSAPFLFLRKEAKSTYDMIHVSGDLSEYTILGNEMYEFVMYHIPIKSGIRILSPGTGFIQHYYLLPLQYRMSGQVETGNMNLTLESRVYDNGIFTVSTSIRYPSTVFLNELQILEHW